MPKNVENKRIVVGENDTEEEIDSIFQDVEVQLLEEKKKLETIKAQINEGNLKDAKKSMEEVEDIDIEKYKKKIEKLKREIYKKMKRQYRNLSISDIMSEYDLDELISLLETIENEKQLLKGQLEVERNVTIMDEIDRAVDSAINSSDMTVDEIAEFWRLVNDSDNSKIGIVKVYIVKGLRPPEISEEIVMSFLEYELSKKFGKPVSTKKLVGHIGDSYDNYEKSRFVDEASDKLSLQERAEINERKEKIKKLREKAEKHPKHYNKPGKITLYAQKKDLFGNVEEQTEFEIEITQGELISFGLDPSEFDWKEIEKAKVHSDDIARVSKDKGTKQSLMSKIAGIFHSRDRKR